MKKRSFWIEQIGKAWERDRAHINQCGFVLKWVLPLDPGRDFLYISAQRGLSYEEYLENN